MSGELDNLAIALASAGVQHTYVKSKPETMAELSQALASAGLKHMLVGAPNEAIAAGPGKRISITYETWDDESLGAGETDDKGWENEEGIEFSDDGDETAVDQAVDFLKKESATEFSASSFTHGGWYSTSSNDSDRDLQTGELTTYSYHLNDGWTDEEKQAIYDGVTGVGSSNEAEASISGIKWRSETVYPNDDEGAFLRGTSPAGEEVEALLGTDADNAAIRANKQRILSTGDTTGCPIRLVHPHSNEAEAAASTVITAAGYTNLDASTVAKIGRDLPFKINKGSVSGSPTFSGSGWAREEATNVIEKLKSAGADYWIYSYQTPILARLDNQWYDIPGKYSPTTTRHQGGLSRQFDAKAFDASVTDSNVRRPVAPGGLDLDAEASFNLGALSHALATAGVKHTIVTAFEPSAPIDVVITSGTVKKQLTIRPNRFAADYNVSQLVGAIEAWSTKYMGPSEATAATEDATEPFFITIKHGAKEVTVKYVQSPYDPEAKTIRSFVQALHTVGGRYKGTQFVEVPHNEATAATEVLAFGATHLPEAARTKIERGLPFKINKGSVSGSPTFQGAGWAENNQESMRVIDKLQTLGADYWLYSYATPIGARVNDQWYIIPGKYSPTTTRHQYILSDLNAQTLDAGTPSANVRRPVAPGGLDLD